MRASPGPALGFGLALQLAGRPCLKTLGRAGRRVTCLCQSEWGGKNRSEVCLKEACELGNAFLRMS